MVDNGGMNRRIILNVMIVALLTFYMIFSIVYKRFSGNDDPQTEVSSELSAERVIWDLPFLVPEQWHLTRIEMSPFVMQLDANDKWSSLDDTLDSDALALIAKSWQTLDSASSTDYMKLPVEGFTVLAFIREDSQPLVFRVLILSDEIHFFRMIDQKQFIYPLEDKSKLLIN
jgi:hypothetical protein